MAAQHIPALDAIRAQHPELVVVEPIRAGGQKSVWRATYRGTAYALKMLRATEESAGRARREINIMRECNSPYLVRLGPLDLQEIAVNDEERILYYLEEFIDGQALDQVPKPLALDACKQLGLQMSHAIENLWNAGYVHRDIKPGNIMRRVDEQNYVLLDVGLALDLDASSLTDPGAIVGTRAYLSPDQIRLVQSKRDLDFRSDLHALGVVMYECITGVHPLWNPRVPQDNIVGNILGLRPLPLTDFRADTPASLTEIVLRLLEKEPNMRYARIAFFREELEVVDLP